MILHYVLQGLINSSTRDPFVSIERFPLFFGTVLFSLEAVGLVSKININ